jgi:hypothetical protein
MDANDTYSIGQVKKSESCLWVPADQDFEIGETYILFIYIYVLHIGFRYSSMWVEGINPSVIII